ncbi:hypothetical protein ACFLYF_05575 [Chloroflexota bacterium]
MATQSSQPAVPAYRVVWPSGKLASEPVAPNKPVSDLQGKTVCELWNGLFKGDEIFPLIREKLMARYANMRFIDYNHFGNIHGQNEDEVVANLPARLREHGCDLVVSGVGA